MEGAMIRVLLVDDHKLFRLCLRRMLETNKGLTIVGEAADGESGVAAARELRPDIILMDLLMPGVDGWQMVRQLKQKEDFAQLQIISISALSSDQLAERGGPPEGSHFMAKPVDIGWLKGYLLGLMTPQAWI